MLTLSFVALLSSTVFASTDTKVFYVNLEKDAVVSGNPIQNFPQQNAPKTDRAMSITLYPSLTYQTMKGIGGCFNEIGGIALATLPKEKQNEVMKNLFTDAGASFTFCRTAVGASDFGASAYSYCDQKGDYEMKSFSLDREKNSVIPYIQSAYRYNPDLFLFASPWSPPAWMKVSGRMEGTEGTDIPAEKNRLIDDPKIYKAYALYLSKYVEEYAKQGIHINRLMVQNETDCNPNYPSCLFPPKQMTAFINDYLAPTFKKRKIKADIWGGTYRVTPNSDYEAAILFSDSRIRKNVKGVGMQYQGYRELMEFRQLYPEIPMMHTECVCHGGENSVEQAYGRLAEIAQYILAGAENFAYWNMILNETGESGWGWRQNSLLTIDRKSGEVRYTPDYAVMSLVSRFVRPGDKRIAHHSPNFTTMSFKDEDGKLKFFVINKGNDRKEINIKISDAENVKAVIPPHSFAVVVTP